MKTHIIASEWILLCDFLLKPLEDRMRSLFRKLHIFEDNVTQKIYYQEELLGVLLSVVKYVFLFELISQ